MDDIVSLPQVRAASVSSCTTADTWTAETSGAEAQAEDTLRASARQDADRLYKGETWEIPAGELGVQAAVVRITVEPVNDRPARRRVRVESDYPRGDVPRARMSKTLTFELKPETPGESS